MKEHIFNSGNVNHSKLYQEAVNCEKQDSKIVLCGELLN